MPTTRKPTPAQTPALKRLARADFSTDHFRPELAKQLIRRGLAIRSSVSPTYQRVEWNRPVVGATLWGVVLTEAGRAVLAAHAGAGR